MLIQTSFKSQAGLYDFLADPSAGAIGTINLGVHLPNRAQITGFWVTELIGITSAGAATLSFGTITTDIAVPVSVVNNLMVATAIAGFTAQPLRGVDLDAAPLRIFNTVDITMSIAVAALTAGRLQFLVFYNEFLQ